MCNYCDIAEGAGWKIYQDEKVMILLSSTPATIGHIIVMPVNHYSIIEQVPDFILGHMAMLISKISGVLLQSFSATGYNILVNNGLTAGQKESHFMINLIPRRENDGIVLGWQPRQISQDDLSTLELEITEFTKRIGDFEKEKAPPIDLDKEAEISDLETEENSYRVKHLTRVP